jgi:hypothetical protein
VLEFIKRVVNIILFDFRFPDTQLMTSLAVLALRPISFLGEGDLQEWGNESIKSLADFYGREQIHNYVDPGTKEKVVAKSAPDISATDLPVCVIRCPNILISKHFLRVVLLHERSLQCMQCMMMCYIKHICQEQHYLIAYTCDQVPFVDKT